MVGYVIPATVIDRQDKMGPAVRGPCPFVANAVIGWGISMPDWFKVGWEG